MNLSDKAIEVLTTISLAQFFVIAAILVGFGVFLFKSRKSIKGVFEDYRVKENSKEEFVDKVKQDGERDNITLITIKIKLRNINQLKVFKKFF